MNCKICNQRGQLVDPSTKSKWLQFYCCNPKCTVTYGYQISKLTSGLTIGLGLRNAEIAKNRFFGGKDHP